MVAAVAAAVMGLLFPPAAGFSEGLKAVARVGEDAYYASHHDGNAIVFFTNRSTVIVAGSESGIAGDTDGVGLAARLHGPQGMAWDGGSNVYFVDTFNGKLKRLDIITDHTVTSIVSLGPASPVASNEQGSGGGWFPIAVALGGPSLAFVSNKYNKSVYRIELAAGGAVTEVRTSCEWFKPHGLSVSPAGDRLLVSDDSNGVHLVDLNGIVPHSCSVLSGTAAKWFSFRDVSWINASTALLMERFGPGTVYLWNVDTNRTARIYGGGGSNNNNNNRCWRDDVTGIMPDGTDGGLWKAMNIDYNPGRWPGSIVLADTGANFLRRLAVDPANLALPATATTVPCFNTTHRFTRSNPGTIEHAICGLGDGP
jgi:WD40 repeat protein